jgi:hypothetical protein
MRHPEIWRSVALGVVLLGPMAIVVAMEMPESDDNTARALMLNFGLLAILVGSCAALFLHMAVKAKQRLAAAALAAARLQPGALPSNAPSSDPENLSECWACHFKTYEVVAKCPKCGEPVLSKRTARRAGLLLIVCGVVITGMMTGILISLAPTMLQPGVEIDGSSFTGTAQQGLTFLIILSVLLAFGVTALLYGAWQVKTGRRSKKVVSAMVGVVSVLMTIAWLMRHAG